MTEPETTNLDDDPRGNRIPLAERTYFARRMLIWSMIGLASLALSGLVAAWAVRAWLPYREGSSPHDARYDAGAAVRTTSQRVHREQYDAEQRSLLSSYGWVDQSKSVARIPIERAMELLEAREAQQK